MKCPYCEGHGEHLNRPCLLCSQSPTRRGNGQVPAFDTWMQLVLVTDTNEFWVVPERDKTVRIIRNAPAGKPSRLDDAKLTLQDLVDLRAFVDGLIDHWKYYPHSLSVKQPQRPERPRNARGDYPYPCSCNRPGCFIEWRMEWRTENGHDTTAIPAPKATH